MAISAIICPVERCFSSLANMCSQDRMALKPQWIGLLGAGCLWSIKGVNMRGKFWIGEHTMAECMENDKAVRQRRGSISLNTLYLLFPSIFHSFIICVVLYLCVLLFLFFPPFLILLPAFFSSPWLIFLILSHTPFLIYMCCVVPFKKQG